ncbi:hypothetical protein EG68_06926 [Paragonimus skrjabini miyazakii]|uniref:Uncharacterized protein n=1 Tax=Paragonimus skrjabini miyazakii TaxID=59628 RepID=A0A8S9YLY4_9TREM|nr:hypothetical protein EG68_06926 [Paragonimus skrjabini miyazakii]
MTYKLEHIKFSEIFRTLCSLFGYFDSRGRDDNFTVSEIMTWGDIEMPFIDDCQRSDQNFATYLLTSPTLCASFDQVSTFAEAERPDFRKHFACTPQTPYRSTCGCFPCTSSKHLV